MTGRYDETEGRGPEEPVVVRDRRRIDPLTGEVRPAAPAAEPQDGPKHAAPSEDPVDTVEPVEPVPATHAGPGLGDSIVDDSVTVATGLEKELAERTADLQRLQAEYANYRKRVDRDREQVVAGAKASVIDDLLPLLDDLERAEQHGDLTGAFKAVGEKLVGSLQRSGLEPFGAEGEPFDPSVHQAVQHSTSPDVAGPTVTTVMRRGYRFGERVLRAAMVGVTDHEPGAAPAPAAQDAPVDPPVGGELPLEGELFDENNR
ncbi:nucleotide exchange factor GrpE [Amycolatopsis azurea]|uniref:Protein GrpE n=1 Tax=Amycolatopsis azurea DSM 43854 TaxID=1238180 RepID=M2PLI8_9PSEU|nr:nucleotide exchange factor GrpE [Amycolatopsis azurea]EMD25368.1 Heat shock protein GrpE [Amycolatopsis azurea DSM 43854]OOC04002.1 nucleotide exchange factor GrpE [Amycolatopsis azurea DSM 43854]